MYFTATHWLEKKPEKSFTFNVCYEAIKTINFIKYQPLSIYLFNILPDEIGSMQKVQLLQTEVWWLSQGWAHEKLFDLWAEPATFFREFHFYLNQWRTVFIKTWVFGRRSLNNEPSETITSRKTTDSLVANEKMQTLKEKLEF